MPTISVIILSYAIDDDIYPVNCQCLNSLFLSEDWKDEELEVLLIESNLAANYQYDSRVRVISPEEKFNFHRFLNIGLHNTSGYMVAFCNNDIVFQPGWFSAIAKVKREHPKYMCFSPLDSNYPLMSEDALPRSKDYYIGWENKKHFAGWCFVWERKVFDIIGQFDERFDFYCADDDELQTLRFYAIPNIVVSASEVKHLSQVVTNKEKQTHSYLITDRIKYPLTQEEIRRGYTWLWEDKRFYDGYQKMKAKWGNSQMRKRINRLLEKLPFLNKRPITKILYNKRTISTLSRLTGVKA